MNMTWVRACLIATTVLGGGAPAVVHAQRVGENGTKGAERASQDSLLVQMERGQWEALRTRDTTARV